MQGLVQPAQRVNMQVKRGERHERDYPVGGRRDGWRVGRGAAQGEPGRSSRSE
jgi:hypothetical protein